nr:MAG TPA: hypothetical protein [Caudoviricetes sp.]
MKFNAYLKTQNHKVLGQNPDSNRGPYREANCILLFYLLNYSASFLHAHTRFHRKNTYYHPNKHYKSATYINFTA